MFCFQNRDLYCCSESAIIWKSKVPQVEDPGQKLRRVRDRLNLRVRDVELASLKIAEHFGNDEFAVLINRLSEIENRGLVPTMFRLYSLCAIYRLDFNEVMEWYGISLAALPQAALLLKVPVTHPISFQTDAQAEVLLPLYLDPGMDLRRTSYLSNMIQRWGKLPLLFLDTLGIRDHRYAFIGTEDRFMYPLLRPGTFVMIDETQRHVSNFPSNNEFERPIYFLQHRKGYACAWCHLSDDRLVLQPHPVSGCGPEEYKYPTDIEILGQVTGIAMLLDQPQERPRPRKPS